MSRILNIKICLLLSCLTGLAGKLFSQPEKKLLRSGNDAYHRGRYDEAAKKYGDAARKNPKYDKAYYNLGNATYKICNTIKKDAQFRAKYGSQADSLLKQKYLEAAGSFDSFANGKTTSKDSAQFALHNMGNAYLMAKEYQKAVDAYKKALKYKPSDEDTRYNLAYALQKLKEQQKKDQQKQQQQNQQNNEDKKEEEQKKDLQNKKNQQEKEKQSGQMSKEEAQRMLDALKNAEKKLQAAKKVKGKETDQKQIEKDW